MTTLMKEFTAVLVRKMLVGFCKQTSKERRNDSAANTWSLLAESNFDNCLPPRSFNLAKHFISTGFSYAYHRGLPNNAMCLGSAKSDNGLRSSSSRLYGSCILRLSSTSSW